MKKALSKIAPLLYFRLIQPSASLAATLKHLFCTCTPTSINRTLSTMFTAAVFVSAFATITLLIGSFGGLNVHLTFSVGFLTIILCTIMTPTELPGSYLDFDYYPTQPSSETTFLSSDSQA